MGKARRDGRWINILLALLLLAGAVMTVHEGVAALQTSAAFALPGGGDALRCALSFVPAAALLALAGTGGAQALKRRRAQKRSNTHP